MMPWVTISSNKESKVLSGVRSFSRFFFPFFPPFRPFFLPPFFTFLPFLALSLSNAWKSNLKMTPIMTTNTANYKVNGVNNKHKKICIIDFYYLFNSLLWVALAQHVMPHQHFFATLVQLLAVFLPGPYQYSAVVVDYHAPASYAKPLIMRVCTNMYVCGICIIFYFIHQVGGNLNT